MRILVIGAYGLLGGYVTARLIGDGHQVVGVGREIAVAERRFPAVRWVKADLRHMTSTKWAALLEGMGAVVNCAGALQDGPRDDVRAAHEQTVRELAKACKDAGVRRFVQISAAGVERDVGAFQRTKHAADEVLRSTELDWIILRPGLVLAPAAYGGSALLRGLAAFPLVIPAVHADAKVQTVSVEDVAEAVVRSLDSTTPRFVCDLVSAEPSRLRDILLAMRAWLGLPPARLVSVPGWVGALSAVAADGLSWLGWRSPMRTAAMQQLAAGVTGRAEDAQAHLGFTPRRLAETLARWPSGVQERWFARLYFLKPLVLTVLAGFWAVSGVVGLLSHAEAEALLTHAGLPLGLARAFVFGGSVLDLLLAALTCVRATARLALRGMILLTFAYLAGASLWVPSLWGDPLGPLVKSIPAAALALAALAIMDER
jgi:uncharacterized protein YbjT (DUF2867 family)